MQYVFTPPKKKKHDSSQPDPRLQCLKLPLEKPMCDNTNKFWIFVNKRLPHLKGKVLQCAAHMTGIEWQKQLHLKYFRNQDTYKKFYKLTVPHNWPSGQRHGGPEPGPRTLPCRTVGPHGGSRPGHTPCTAGATAHYHHTAPMQSDANHATNASPAVHLILPEGNQETCHTARKRENYAHIQRSRRIRSTSTCKSPTDPTSHRDAGSE
jgi:hypothetical protein